MSTPQPQTPTGDSPASPENRSLTNLRRDLDDEADLLKYIPYQRATFQRQDELPGAFSDRLLYGDMMEEKDQLWIYFTLLGGGQTYNKETGSNRMLSFFTLHAAKNGGAPLRPSRVQDAALASAPFKMARDGFQIIAIAKYFFIKRGVDDKLKVPLSSNTFRDDLLRACKAYKAAFDRQELTRQLVPRHPTAKIDGHSAAPSRDVSRASSHTPPEPQAAPAQQQETPLQHQEPLSHRQDKASEYGHTFVQWQERHSQHKETPSQVREPTSQLFREMPSQHQEAPSQYRETPAVARGPTTTRSPSHAVGDNNSRKRTRSSRSHDLARRGQSRYSSTPPSVGQRSPPLAEEEELDRQIDEAENERSEIAAQLVGIKSRLDEVNEKKSTLLVEKERIKAKKKGIQGLLNADEMLEFGFEAGRKMEAKRQKRA